MNRQEKRPPSFSGLIGGLFDSKARAALFANISFTQYAGICQHVDMSHRYTDIIANFA